MQFARLTLVLAFVSAIAAGALALTYSATREKIKAQEQAAKSEALKGIFFLLESTEHVRPLTGHEDVLGVYASKEAMDAGEEPLYYAAEGAGFGYNTSKPIRLLVGFTNPRRPAAAGLEGYLPAGADWGPSGEEKGLYLVGWRVITSEETPGLGEKAKEEKPAYTLYEKVTGTATEAGPDRRTPFQAQFAGRKASADALLLKNNGGPIDIITAATYSTRGIVDATLDAAATARSALQPSP